MIVNLIEKRGPMDRIAKFSNKLLENVSKVIVGKDKEIELVIVAFLSNGHVLLEDIPGTGKTMMIRAFSKTLDLPFKRIQFTPDLLPSDITGINFYNQKTGDFEFRQGPLFSNIVLADEINRATPRTQSSLLEAMEEKQISSDGITRKLKEPFMVLATQNPVESFGTFPLPEAQLDRFLMRLSLGYPVKDDEKNIVLKNINNPIDKIGSIIDSQELDTIYGLIDNVTISDEVLDYLVDIVNATRDHNKIELGVSPRGSIALFKASRVYAAINGRDYILPEDIKYLAPYILNHRLIARGTSDVEKTMELINELVENIKVPLEEI